MKVGDTNRYAYNAQAIAADAQARIIACEANLDGNDTGQLVTTSKPGKSGVAAAETVVADTGYGSGADLQAASQKQMNVLAPPPGKPAQDNLSTPRGNTFLMMRRPTPSPVRRAGIWITKGTPQK